MIRFEKYKRYADVRNCENYNDIDDFDCRHELVEVYSDDNNVKYGFTSANGACVTYFDVAVVDGVEIAYRSMNSLWKPKRDPETYEEIPFTEDEFNNLVVKTAVLRADVYDKNTWETRAQIMKEIEENRKRK